MASKVIYNVIANNRSNLILDGREITRDEDVFPFRAQWASATEVIYTADGKIKKRSLAGGEPSPIEFTAAISFTRTPYQRRGRAISIREPRDRCAASWRRSFRPTARRSRSSRSAICG